MYGAQHVQELCSYTKEGIMAAAAPASRRNVVRFQLLEDLEMDRLFFSRHILQKELKITTDQLDFVFAFPGKKIFEVVFTSQRSLERCLKEFETKKTSPAFRKIEITPLTEVDRRTVHVVILSERVRIEDIKTWMSNFCDIISASEVVDIDGIKTGARRFEVKLRRENGHVKHLPNSIQLGVLRGSVFYPGQPKKCRKCGSLEHLAAVCTSTMCRNCNAGNHSTAQCPVPIKCNLCSSESHLFRDCPQAYSNRLKQSRTVAASEFYPDNDATPIGHAQVSAEQTLDIPPSSCGGPQGELISKDSIASANFQEAEKLLDELILNFPSCAVPETVETDLPGSIKEHASRISAHPSQAIGEEGEKQHSSTDEAVKDQRWKKRMNESPSPNRSSVASSPGLPMGPWPHPSPTQNPFLEQEDVVAFTVATKIKEIPEEKAIKPKRKKNKGLTQSLDLAENNQ